MLTEQNGAVLNLAVNTPQVGTRIAIRTGGMVRLDSRAGVQLFTVLGYPIAGGIIQPIQVSLESNAVGLNGNAPVAKAAAIAAPTDLASCITAINAIRAALTAIGITA